MSETTPPDAWTPPRRAGVSKPSRSTWPAGRWRHQGARPADLPDHQLHLRQHRSRGRAVRSRRARQHLHPNHEPHSGRGRAAHRGSRRWRRGAAAVLRPGRRDLRHPEPRRGRRPHRRQPVPVRRHLQPAALHPAQAGHRGLLRRGPPTTSSSGPRRSARTPRRSTARPSPIRRTTSSTFPVSPASHTTMACR